MITIKIKLISINRTQVITRNMLTRAMIKVGEKTAEKVAPIVVNNDNVKSYATYAVTNQESSQDTSKVNHPTVVKESCNDEDCHNKNCAQDPNKCDHETQATAIVAHITHSPKGVEAGKPVIPVELDEGTIYAVVYQNSQKVDELYTGFKYKETLAFQSDDITNKMNEATKNQEPLEDDATQDT